MRRRPVPRPRTGGFLFMSARVLRGATMVVAGLTSVMRMPAFAASTATATGPAVAAPGTGLRRPRTTTPVAPPRTVRDEAVLSRGQRVVYWALTALWAVVVLQFWRWWLAPAHRGALGLYVATSIPLAYLTTACPASTGSSSGACAARSTRTRRPAGGSRSSRCASRRTRRSTSSPTSCGRSRRCATRTTAGSWTRAPTPRSRRWPRARRPLLHAQGPAAVEPARAALPGQDEGGQRQRMARLRPDGGPGLRRLRPARHRPPPAPEYLERTLGYFDDPDVAWVQAPSVCANLDSWTARGLAEQDLVLQGPLQMGFYGHSRTPFIIGSHTSYRTSAIRAIGGYQPTRAEDHLDTVVLAAAGLHGRVRPGDHRRGRRPVGLRDLPGQQFAWAYSMVQIFLRHTPRLVRRYTPAQAFQFLMAQSWYTLWSLSLAVLWVLPMVALLSGHRSPTSRCSSTSPTTSRRPVLEPHVVVEPPLVPADRDRPDLARPRCSRWPAGRSCCGP